MCKEPGLGWAQVARCAVAPLATPTGAVAVELAENTIVPTTVTTRLATRVASAPVRRRTPACPMTPGYLNEHGLRLDAGPARLMERNAVESAGECTITRGVGVRRRTSTARQDVIFGAADRRSSVICGARNRTYHGQRVGFPQAQTVGPSVDSAPAGLVVGSAGIRPDDTRSLTGRPRRIARASRQRPWIWAGNRGEAIGRTL